MGKQCNGVEYGRFSTQAAAKTACADDTNCKGVYDPACDDQGIFYLCPNTATYRTSSSSCIYEKNNPSCNDGLLNQDEEQIDCGGSCEACPTCNDSILNQNEVDIDC